MVQEKTPFGVNLTKRVVSPGGEKELFYLHKIGKSGEVELVDYMGGDRSVEYAATLGIGKGIFKEKPGQKEFIGYLAKNKIDSPFKSVQLKFSIQSSIRSALSFVYDSNCSVNEYSGRYSEMLDTSYSPGLEKIVGMLGEKDFSKAKIFLEKLENLRKESLLDYKELISPNIDMARELARGGLGINNDTRYYWKMDLPSLASFVKKYDAILSKDDPTRGFLENISSIASGVAPLSWDALMNGYSENVNLTMPKDEEIVDGDLSSPWWGSQKTKRITVPDFDKSLFKIVPFLDHGQFMPIDYMGDDSSFAQAARTSYGKGTKTLTDDNKLVDSLIRDLHTSPVEMSEISFMTRAPVFTDPRQFGRHRTLDNSGFMGYTPIGNKYYFPDDSQFKHQDKLNRQGRGKEMDEPERGVAKRLVKRSLERELKAAKEFRKMEAPEEVIRDIKGVSFYTKRWRTGDIHNLQHMLGLRWDGHAQYEIRVLAEVIAGAHKMHTPNAYNSFIMHNKEGMKLSSKEVDWIKNNKMIISEINPEDIFLYKNVPGFTFESKKNNEEKLGREGKAAQSKLKRFLGK